MPDPIVARFTLETFAGPDHEKQVSRPIIDLLPAVGGGFDYHRVGVRLADDDIAQLEPVLADRIHEKDQPAIAALVELPGLDLLKLVQVGFPIDHALRRHQGLGIEPYAGIDAGREKGNQHQQHRAVKMPVTDAAGIHDHDFVILVHAPEGKHDAEEQRDRQ